MHYVDLSGIHPCIFAGMLQHFEHSNGVGLRNEIMFDFNPGLPQIVLNQYSSY